MLLALTAIELLITMPNFIKIGMAVVQDGGRRPF